MNHHKYSDITNRIAKLSPSGLTDEQLLNHAEYKTAWAYAGKCGREFVFGGETSHTDTLIQSLMWVLAATSPPAKRIRYDLVKLAGADIGRETRSINKHDPLAREAFGRKLDEAIKEAGI